MSLAPGNHIINREVFEFTCPHAEHAFELQGRMNGGIQYEISSAINDIFNEFDTGGIHCRIDKLEIDLGEITFENINQLLPQKFYQQFKEKFWEVAYEKKVYNGREEKFSIQDKMNLLKEFLLTGGLPWWISKEEILSIDEILASLEEHNNQDLRLLILRHIFNDKFIERLFFQTRIELYDRLLKTIGIVLPVYPHNENEFDTISQFIPGLNKISFENNDQLSEGNLKDITVHTIRKTIAWLITKLITAEELQLSGEQIHFILKEQITDLLKNTIPANILDEIINTFINNNTSVSIKKIKEELKNELTQADTSNTREFQNRKIYIQNAGLVLIATFFSALFNELQCTEDGKFAKKEQQFKALFLLHYMCTGKTEAPEYTLQLNKILCGLNLDEPIPFSLQITEREKQETELLLIDILTHWTALKNSSVEGLRGSFLLRGGLLSFKNDHWLLQVERKGYDILLDHIPWSWTMIKLDWMETYIEVEW